MLVAIGFLARKIFLEDISQARAPTAPSKLSIFNCIYFVQSDFLFVDLFVCSTIFESDAMNFLETLQGLLKAIILVVQIHEIVLTSFSLPRRAVLNYFLVHFCLPF